MAKAGEIKVTVFLCGDFEERIHRAMENLCEIERRLWSLEQDLQRELELNPYEEADIEEVPIEIANDLDLLDDAIWGQG